MQAEMLHVLTTAVEFDDIEWVQTTCHEQKTTRIPSAADKALVSTVVLPNSQLDHFSGGLSF